MVLRSRRPLSSGSRFIFPALKEIYVPHLVSLYTTDPTLHELLQPGQTVFESLSHFHIWRESFNDGTAIRRLQRLQPQLPAAVIHEGQLEDTE